MQVDEGKGGTAITQSVLAYAVDEGLDCSALLLAIGLTRSDIARLLDGSRTLAAEEYVAICEMLGVPLSRFVCP